MLGGALRTEKLGAQAAAWGAAVLGKEGFDGLLNPMPLERALALASADGNGVCAPCGRARDSAGMAELLRELARSFPEKDATPLRRAQLGVISDGNSDASLAALRAAAQRSSEV